MSEASRRRRAARMKALHADPEFKARTSARMKALNADPEFKARLRATSSARMKALNADPEFNPLADLAPEQRKLYHKARRVGVPREIALKEVRRVG